MIVKNEAHIIERNLRCTLPIVDTWCIVDTGSTDETMDIIRKISDEMGKPGFLYERPWVNFGKNRSEALELASNHMSWTFMMDADDTASGTIDKSLLDEKADGYRISIQHGNILHRRPQLFNAKLKWVFVGAVHEYAQCMNGTGNVHPFKGTLKIEAHTEGARSKNPDRFKNDAALLEKEIASNPADLGRSLFYLAESYRSDGQLDKALEVYLRRTKERNTGWYEEVYFSYMMLIKHTMDPRQALDYAWKAQDIVPARREAAYEAIVICRKNNYFTQEVYALGLAFKDAPMSDDHLFTGPWAYTWSYDDEFGIVAFYTGHSQQGFQSSTKAYESCPESEKNRIKMNIAFAIEKVKANM